MTLHANIPNAKAKLVVMKTVLVDMYTRYTTRLLDEDRTEKRPWEGADRMSELQFESLITCAESESIEKRVPRSSIYSQDIPQEGGTEKPMEPARSPSMFQKSKDALGVIGNVGRRPFVSALDTKYNAPQRVGNNERQLSLSSPESSSLQPAKNDATEKGTSMIPPDPIPKQLSHTLRNPSLNPSISPTSQTTPPAQRRPSLLPSLLSMPPASERAERAESAELVENLTQIKPSQQTRKGPIARLKRPQLLHRTSAPERVDGVLELVGQDSF